MPRKPSFEQIQRKISKQVAPDLSIDLAAIASAMPEVTEDPDFPTKPIPPKVISEKQEFASFKNFWTSLGFDYPDWLDPIPTLLFNFRLFRISEEWQNRNICVTVPPGHSKSYTLMIGMLWLAATLPNYRVMYLTYSVPQSEAQSVILQQLADRLGIKFKSRSRAEWLLTNGSTLMFNGIDGSVNGRRADLIIIDDPYADEKQAWSQVGRDQLVQRLQGVIFSRIAPGTGANILVSTGRWHPDDIVAYLTSKEQGFSLISLPAWTLDKDNPDLRFPHRKPLAAHLFNIAALDRIRRRQGDRIFNAQYLQNPSYADGAFYQASQLKYLPEPIDPDKLQLNLCIGVDFAYSKANQAKFDNCAMVVLGVDSELNYYLLDAHSERCNYMDYIYKMKEFKAKYTCNMVSIASGFEKQIIETVNSSHPELNIISMPAFQNKESRAQLSADAFNAGRFSVYIPADNTNNVPLSGSGTQFATLLNELFTFEGGKQKGHDDSVDAMVSAFNYISQNNKPKFSYGNGIWGNSEAVAAFL